LEIAEYPQNSEELVEESIHAKKNAQAIQPFL